MVYFGASHLDVFFSCVFSFVESYSHYCELRTKFGEFFVHVEYEISKLRTIADTVRTTSSVRFGGRFFNVVVKSTPF